MQPNASIAALIVMFLAPWFIAARIRKCRLQWSSLEFRITYLCGMCSISAHDWPHLQVHFCLCSPVGFLCFELKHMLSTIVFFQACSASTSLEEEVESAPEELPRSFSFRFKALLGLGTIPVAQTIHVRTAVFVLVSAPQRISTSRHHFG